MIRYFILLLLVDVVYSCGVCFGENADQDAGIALVRRALEAPLRQIAENAGVDGAVVAGKIRESKDASFGFNTIKTFP